MRNVCNIAAGFFERLGKKTQGRENSSLMRITQNSNKKLKDCQNSQSQGEIGRFKKKIKKKTSIA